MDRKEKLLPILIGVNVVIVLILLISALSVFSSGTREAQTAFIETMGKTYLTMFLVEPLAIAFYLYWPDGE